MFITLHLEHNGFELHIRAGNITEFYQEKKGKELPTMIHTQGNDSCQWMVKETPEQVARLIAAAEEKRTAPKRFMELHERGAKAFILPERVLAASPRGDTGEGAAVEVKVSERETMIHLVSETPEQVMALVRGGEKI